MLVSLNDCSLQRELIKFGLQTEYPEDVIKNSVINPLAEATVYRIPRTVTLRPVSYTHLKDHSKIETREYYQTEDIVWMEQKKEWKGLKSIVMEKKTLETDGIEKE